MITRALKLKRYSWALVVAVFLSFVPLSFGMHIEPPIAHAQFLVPGTLITQAGAAVAGTVTSKLSEAGAGIVEGFVNFGGQFLLMIGSAILYLGGVLFDWTMDLFVVNFTTWVKSPEIWNSIIATWTIVRDVCNLAFIFGFIYIGISTILSPDNASMKRFLAKIIIGAILINFSLYLTQVVIDFTNFTAVQVYNAINPNEDQSIASAIKSYLGTDQTFFNIRGDDLASMGQDWAKSASYYFLVCVFLMVAGLTLLIAAFHLLVRFIELLLIMIFSPIYFAAQVFPGTEKHAEKIMGRLISSAFYAPVYLLLLYLVLTIANAFSKRLEGDFVATLVRGDVGAAGVIVNYCIIIALMWSAIHLGKMMSVTGGDMAIKWGTKARQGAQRGLGAATFGMGARFGRATVGRKAYELADSDRLKDYAARSGVGKVLLKSSRALSDASFDARNVGEVGKKTGLGEGRKGGYKTVKEEVKKKESEFARSLGTVDDGDFQVEARKKEMEAAKRRFEADKQSLNKKIGEIQGDSVEAIEQRSGLRKQIDDLEKAYNDAKIKYEKEKQRRILGSTFATESGEVKKQKEELELRKTRLKKFWKDYTDAVAANNEVLREAARSNIEQQKESIKQGEEVLAELLKTGSSDRGYAGKLENRSRLASWLVGRLNEHDREAGKEMRKTAEKGLPKEKE